MQFDWKVAVGDMQLSEEQFRLLASQNMRLIQYQGQWIQLDPALLKQVQQMMKRVGKKGLSFRDVLEMHLLGADGDPAAEMEEGSDSGAREQSAIAGSQEESEILDAPLRMEVELNEHLSGMIGQLSHNGHIPRVEPPVSFQGKLRNYQAEGSSWLRFLRRFGLGGCLADDMGLGKTVQWIVYLLHVKETDKPDAPALLICPTSVLGNWAEGAGTVRPFPERIFALRLRTRQRGGVRDSCPEVRSCSYFVCTGQSGRSRTVGRYLEFALSRRSTKY
jgi:SNF2 family DNA or RNA helicase